MHIGIGLAMRLGYISGQILERLIFKTLFLSSLKLGAKPGLSAYLICKHLKEKRHATLSLMLTAQRYEEILV